MSTLFRIVCNIVSINTEINTLLTLAPSLVAIPHPVGEVILVAFEYVGVNTPAVKESGAGDVPPPFLFDNGMEMP